MSYLSFRVHKCPIFKVVNLVNLVNLVIDVQDSSKTVSKVLYPSAFIVLLTKPEVQTRN